MSALALILGLFVFGCASSGDSSTSDDAVQNRRDPKFLSFEIGDKKFDLYALLESSKASPENWQLLSINVVKTSNDGKYIAIGSSEKILTPMVDVNGKDVAVWRGTGMVTVLDSTDGTVLYHLDDDQQKNQIRKAVESMNSYSAYVKQQRMNNNLSPSQIEMDMIRLNVYRNDFVYLLDADLGIGFLEFTPDDKYLISAPRQLGRNSKITFLTIQDWVVLWSLETGLHEWSYSARFEGIKSLELIEDGSKIKVIDGRDRVTIINVDTGEAE